MDFSPRPPDGGPGSCSTGPNYGAPISGVIPGITFGFGDIFWSVPIHGAPGPLSLSPILMLLILVWLTCPALLKRCVPKLTPRAGSATNHLFYILLGSQGLLLLGAFREALARWPLAPMRVALVLIPPRTFFVAGYLFYQTLGSLGLLWQGLQMAALALSPLAQ